MDDELVKVIRISESDDESTDVPSIPRSLRGHVPPLSSNFLMQVISSVRFTPLLNSPVLHTEIPSQVWEPSIHQHYPESFRRSCKEILLCSHAPTYQPPPAQVHVQHRTNTAATLPRAIWIEILSYTDRTWFEKPRTADESLLRRRLLEEQAAARRAQEARLQAESRLQLVEREREVYRLLALRWQSRLQGIMRERGGLQDDDSMVDLDDYAEIARSTASLSNEPLMLRLGTLSALIRQFQRDSDNEEEEEEAFPDGEDSESDNMDDEDLDDDDVGDSDEAMSVTADSSPAMNLGRPAQAVPISRSDS